MNLNNDFIYKENAPAKKQTHFFRKKFQVTKKLLYNDGKHWTEIVASDYWIRKIRSY